LGLEFQGQNGGGKQGGAPTVENGANQQWFSKAENV